jgi:hypothetical protein
MSLYHVTLGFPKNFNPSIGTVMLTYSNHAHHASTSDRLGNIVLPRSLNTNNARCIELEYDNGQVLKLVYRTAYDSTKDLVIVCRPKGNLFVVATVWLNLKTDKHATLDTSKYETP